jgi:1,4-alpha-glucan branching enzyme
LDYGGSGFGNAGAPLPIDAVPAHGRTHSVLLNLPPLATLFLVSA